MGLGSGGGFRSGLPSPRILAWYRYSVTLLGINCESFPLFKSSVSPCDIQGIRGYRIKLLPIFVAGDPPFYVRTQLTTGTKVKMVCGHQPVWKLPEQRGLCIHYVLGTLLYHGIQRQWEPPWVLGIIRGHLTFPRSQGCQGRFWARQWSWRVLWARLWEAEFMDWWSLKKGGGFSRHHWGGVTMPPELMKTDTKGHGSAPSVLQLPVPGHRSPWK